MQRPRRGARRAAGSAGGRTGTAGVCGKRARCRKVRNISGGLRSTRGESLCAAALPGGRGCRPLWDAPPRGEGFQRRSDGGASMGRPAWRAALALAPARPIAGVLLFLAGAMRPISGDHHGFRAHSSGHHSEAFSLCWGLVSALPERGVVSLRRTDAPDMSGMPCRTDRLGKRSGGGKKPPSKAGRNGNA